MPISKNPNPQGKGGSLVLNTLDAQRRDLPAVRPKQIDQVSTELFTSLFVLQSDFRFKPIRGKELEVFNPAPPFFNPAEGELNRLRFAAQS